MIPLALLRRVPGIVWVGVFCLALSVAAGFGIYEIGQREGARAVRQAAVRDSVVVQSAHVDTITRHADAAVAVARVARGRSETARDAVRVAEPAGLAALDSAPVDVRSLVVAQREALAADSVVIVGAFVAIDSLERERAARIALDSLRARQLEIGAPPRHTGRAVAVALVAGAVVGWVVSR